MAFLITDVGIAGVFYVAGYLGHTVVTLFLWAPPAIIILSSFVGYDWQFRLDYDFQPFELQDMPEKIENYEYDIQDPLDKNGPVERCTVL